MLDIKSFIYKFKFMEDAFLNKSLSNDELNFLSEDVIVDVTPIVKSNENHISLLSVRKIYNINI